MKKLLSIVVIALTVVIFTSCGDDKKEDKATEGKTDSTKVETIEVDSPATLTVSPEMEEFMGMFDGTYQKVEEGLAKFGSTDEIKDDDMGMYDMSEPVVSSADGECYVMEAKAGMTVRIYKICWVEGLIGAIEFIEMK